MPTQPELAELAANLFAAWGMGVYTVWLNGPNGPAPLRVAAEDETSVRAVWANDPNLIAIQAPSADIPAAVTVSRPYAAGPVAGLDRARPHQEADHA